MSSTQILVNRGEYLLGLTLQLLALPPVLLLLAAPRRVLSLKRGLAGSLLVYLCVSLAFLLPTLAYSILMVYSTWIGPCTVNGIVQYDVYWMFWTGLWSVAATGGIANATFFLTLDRCLTLLFPFKYPKKLAQFVLLTIDVITNSVIYAGFVCLLLVEELPLDVVAASKCLNHPCTATKWHYKYHVLFRTIHGFLNLGVGIVFLSLLRCKTTMDSAESVVKMNKTRNRVVIMTIVSEIVLKIMPGLATYVVNNFTSLLISDSLGWIIMILSSVDTCAVSIYYAAVLIKWPELIRIIRSKFGYSDQTLAINGNTKNCWSTQVELLQKTDRS